MRKKAICDLTTYRKLLSHTRIYVFLQLCTKQTAIQSLRIFQRKLNKAAFNWVKGSGIVSLQELCNVMLKMSLWLSTMNIWRTNISGNVLSWYSNVHLYGLTYSVIQDYYPSLHCEAVLKNMFKNKGTMNQAKIIQPPNFFKLYACSTLVTLIRFRSIEAFRAIIHTIPSSW